MSNFDPVAAIKHHFATYRFIASDNVITARRDECRKCDQKENKAGVDFCKSCGCILVIKTRVADSVCPLNLWSKQ